MCKGWFASPTTLATPQESIVHLNSYTASDMPTDTMEQRIAYARTCSGLSYTAIANAIGVHKDYYKIIEKKCDRISVEHLLSICRATSSDPSWIIYGSCPPPCVPLNSPTLGQRIREFRKSRNITCRSFSQTAFNMPRYSSIPKWETDRMIPELRTLMRISVAYGISVVSFILPASSDQS